MELFAEFVWQDGKRQQLRVSCEAPGGAAPYQGLLVGLAKMRQKVDELLSPMIQREMQDQIAAAAEEALDGDGDDDDDDAEDENSIDNRANSDEPSAKRPEPPS
ncbi:EKC/KEOPS complex subunit GON7 [Orycteropus afer afer]|uniref:EKC/KEOPS complex subunit GON7 n=1 Tax=Orycteropus afer afer TaxID=1230840 RepID=A0A8B7A420_ORYAF|nr:EKC/KEOPS complex subunit GON7 [Orycteropus afer afer]